MATTDHNKHSHSHSSGLFHSHSKHESRSSNYADNHKHFHANATAPSGFHLPHHASTAPNLTAIPSSDDSDNEPTFPPHPPNQHQHQHHQGPSHAHTFNIPMPHIDYLEHHHRELSIGHDARHAKHDAAKSVSSEMPTYVQQQSRHLTEAEEIKQFEEAERERKRKEEQVAADRKSWEEVIKGRERARRTSGAFGDRDRAAQVVAETSETIEE